MILSQKVNLYKDKIEYGDFQTPLELTEQICQHLKNLGVSPDYIIEPTCGVGNFIESASHTFKSLQKIIGVEVNKYYVREIEAKSQFMQGKSIDILCADFFLLDWSSLINSLSGDILVLGNLPWVTNSQQGSIDGKNLPKKNNFQKYTGLDAITGKSNFDISEWMLIQIIHWFQDHNGYLAMVCKTSVSRKVLNYIHSQNLNLAYCASYKIDSKKYFGANVEACLLFCEFDLKSKNYFCDVFQSFSDLNSYRIGYRNNILIRDTISFDKLSNFYSVTSEVKWRSGVKHDCSNIMEFQKQGDYLANGLGEIVDLEDTYLFPLLKGSDIAQGRIKEANKYVLVTQKSVGEDTECIKDLAPKTWAYLESHSEYLGNRKSKIYQNNPRFSIFGVGSYTFSYWKIAISGLYKKLNFQLIGQISGKPVIFDDTVYFLSFEDEAIAQKTLQMLCSGSIKNFYSSLIFWDEKRPIKSSILNCLNINELVKSTAQTL
jgi:hypothetical protein